VRVRQRGATRRSNRTSEDTRGLSDSDTDIPQVYQDIPPNFTGGSEYFNLVEDIEDIGNEGFKWSQASTFSYDRNSIDFAIAYASAIHTHLSVRGTAHPMSTLLLPLCCPVTVTTYSRKVKHHTTALLRVPQLVVSSLDLTLTTRKSMYARMSPLQTGMLIFVRAL